MKLILDRYAHLESPIHRWHQEYKLIGLLALIFAFSFVKHLLLLPFIVAITGVLFLVSRLPFSYLLSRLRYPGWFILAIVFLIPFTVGDHILWQLGWLSLKLEGIKTALLIVIRFLCILTTSIVLFGTAPFLQSIKALRFLGLPKPIVDMTLLAYRYLEELGETLSRMQRSIKLRGFNSKQKINSRYLKTLSSLVGSLFVRSYERSQKIYFAMILRGYGNPSQQNRHHKYEFFTQENLYNIQITVLCLLLSVGILLAEKFLSG